MVICDDCKHTHFDSHRFISTCHCRENVIKKFIATFGEYTTVRNENFCYESNKDGTCIWFVPKKQKWWKFCSGLTSLSKKVPDFTPFTNDRIDELLTFIREKHPEVIIEFEFTKDSRKEEVSKSRAKPTPNPTGGINRV